MGEVTSVLFSASVQLSRDVFPFLEFHNVIGPVPPHVTRLTSSDCLLKLPIQRDACLQEHDLIRAGEDFLDVHLLVLPVSLQWAFQMYPF